MKFSRQQRDRTFAALQAVADDEGARIERTALESVFDAGERGEPAAIRQLEKVNGVIALFFLRQAKDLPTA